MKELKFDFNNMLSQAVGSAHGISGKELAAFAHNINRAHKHIRQIVSNDRNRVNLSLEWVNLPFQDKQAVKNIQKLGDSIAAKFENVIFLGIGGSYLGLKAAQDALAPAYYNDFPVSRKDCPRIYFEGNNLDPLTLNVLLKNLNPKKTFVVVISKSGETTETKAAFAVVEPWLKKGAGKFYGRQVIAITDPSSGTLRRKVDKEQAKDKLSFRSLPLLKGVGGRFSEFNMGLLHLAIIGVKLGEVLYGAAEMAKRCASPVLHKNPALMYAVLQFLLYKKKHKPVAIMMPFGEALKSTADWYSQLLAESLGKKYARKIILEPDGTENWLQDLKRIVNTGRTPVPARGTNDLHSIQQNNIEGENDKTVTFIRVEKFKDDLKVPGKGDILSGKYYGRLLNLAQEACEWALVREKRPNCAIIMPQLCAYNWGELLFFFEMATAYEGEFLNVNAFDQPGVEGYKNYMYFKLRKPGLSSKIAEEIRAKPLSKDPRFII